MSPRLVLFLLICLVLSFTSSAVPQPQMNLDSLFANQRLLDSYLKCYLDRGPCPPAVKKAKKHLPELITTSCGSCTPDQKKAVKLAMRRLRQTRPKAYTEILAKYEPSTKHWASFNSWLSSS